MNTIPTPEYQPEKNAITAAKIVAILYILGFFTGVAFIVGVIVAYIYRQDAHGWLESHYRYLIRTFWIGLLYSAIAGLLVFILIGIPLLFLVTLWWIVRCVNSFRQIEKSRPIIDVNTWII